MSLFPPPYRFVRPRGALDARLSSWVETPEVPSSHSPAGVGSGGLILLPTGTLPRSSSSCSIASGKSKLVPRKQCDSESGLLTLVPRGLLLLPLLLFRVGESAPGDGVIHGDGGVALAMAKSHRAGLEPGSCSARDIFRKSCWS